MALPPILPKPSAPIVTAAGLTNTEWYEFFRLLRIIAGDNVDAQAQIAALAARVLALEESQTGDVELQGPYSVKLQGTLAQGLVRFLLENDDAAPEPRTVYGANADGDKGWTPVLVENLAGSTYSTLQHYVNTMTSPGIITGCDLSQLDTDTVQVSAGTGMIRVVDDDVSSLVFFDIPASTFDIPADQETRFYGVVYSAGAVSYDTRLVDDWDKDTEIPLGSAVRFNGTMVTTPNKYRTGDPITNVIQRFYANLPASRDNSVGGLVLGETGTRNVTLSAGRIWSRLSDFDSASKDSSTAPMLSVFFNGTNLTFTSGITQWDNLQYNDLGSGALVTLGNNKYANLWFFLSIDGSQYGFAYGTGEYNTLGEAADEGIPPYLTQDFFNQSLLVGRFLFQKSAATASHNESAFLAAFSSAAINDHNSLGGLQGGTTGEFYHLTAAEVEAVQSGGINPYATYLVDEDGNYLVDPDGDYLVSDDGFPIPQAYGGTGAVGPSTSSTFLRGDGVYSSELFGAQLFTIDGAGAGLTLTKYSNDTAAYQARFQKARGTLAVPAAVQSGDTLLSFQGRGYQTTTNAFGGNVGALELAATEAFTSTAQGTRWEFSATPVGSVTRVNVLFVESTGMRPATDNAVTSGTSAMRWSQVFGREFRPGGGTPIWTSGSGTPEGAVTAPVGSLFTRTDGGAATTLYVKESGAGNTGWVAK